MISFSDNAKQKIQEFISGAGDECVGLRLRAAKVGQYTFRYQIQLVREQDTADNDQRVEVEGFSVYLDPQTAEWMQGSTIDFLDTETGSGFQISNPAAEPDWEDPVARKVQEVLDHKVLPVLGGHGGWVELDRIEGDTAYVRLGGGCQGCSSATFTLKEGIESVITKEVPEIARVIDETDHGSGASPYYSG
jgi:Fe/S biogenesis protein NfuA